jgi:hypothetical protein
VLLHGVVWWAWHLPFVVGAAARSGLTGAKEAGLPQSLVVSSAIGVVVVGSLIAFVLHAVVFAYIWLRSGSLAVTTVYHAAFDGVRDTLGMVIGMNGLAFAGVWANVVIVGLGIVLIWKADWTGLATAGPIRPSFITACESQHHQHHEEVKP